MKTIRKPHILPVLAAAFLTASCGIAPSTGPDDKPGTDPDNPDGKQDPSEIMIETSMLAIHVWPGQTGSFTIRTEGDSFTVTVKDPSIATAVVDDGRIIVSAHDYGQTTMTVSDGVHKSREIGIYTFLDGILRLPDEYEKFLPEVTVEASDSGIADTIAEDVLKWQSGNISTEYWFTQDTGEFIIKKTGEDDVTGTFTLKDYTMTLAFEGTVISCTFAGRQFGCGPGPASADLTWDMTEKFAGKYPHAGITKVTVRQCYQAIAPVPYWNTWNNGELI